MSDNIKRQIESGEADPSDFLNDGNRPTQPEDTINEGTATDEDLRTGKVDPTSILDGSVNVGSPSEASSSFTVGAEDLADRDTREDFAQKAQHTQVQVQLSGNDEYDMFAESWAEDVGATVVE